MLVIALDSLVGAVLATTFAAEATGRDSGIGSLTICFDEVVLVSQAQVGFWLTWAAMTAIAANHIVRSPMVRGWIAQLRSAWTLQHAPTRPRRWHPAHRP